MSFQRRIRAATAASKLDDPGTTAAGPSVAELLKQGWHASSAVAYEYVKILDVMVGQAPEYVGLAYGAINILPVAQVNNEEMKGKVKGVPGADSAEFPDNRPHDCLYAIISTCNSHLSGLRSLQHVPCKGDRALY